MTKLALKLFITDEGYRAIGHVAAQWAYLETELDLLLSIFLELPVVKNLELKNVQSFNKRMKNFKKASEVALENKEIPLEEIKSIIVEATSLRGFRDDIVHGQWRLCRKGSSLSPGITSIKNFPTYKVKEKKFTYEKAEDIAAKISQVTLRVINWRMKYVKTA